MILIMIPLYVSLTTVLVASRTYQHIIYIIFCLISH